MKKISLNELAQKLNLSKTTVSMVLNGKGDEFKINSSTQERVVQLANEYDYRPNQLARNLSQGKSMTLGLIVPTIADSFYSTCTYYFENLASARSYKVIIGSARENVAKEAELLRTFEDQQVDGILIASMQRNLDAIQKISQSGMPIVLFDRLYGETNLPGIQIDSFQGIKLLVEHAHNKGHTEIGYIGIDLDLKPLYVRRESHATTVKNLFSKDPKQTMLNYENYKELVPNAVASLMKQGCDAIVFETHFLAIEALKYISKSELEKDVRVSSFGDHDIFEIFKPNVTAIDFLPEQLMKAAAEMLLDLIENDKSSGNIKILPPRIIIRD